MYYWARCCWFPVNIHKHAPTFPQEHSHAVFPHSNSQALLHNMQILFDILYPALLQNLYCSLHRKVSATVKKMSFSSLQTSTYVRFAIYCFTLHVAFVKRVIAVSWPMEKYSSKIPSSKWEIRTRKRISQVSWDLFSNCAISFFFLYITFFLYRCSLKITFPQKKKYINGK